MLYIFKRLFEKASFPLIFLISIPAIIFIRNISKWYVIRWACLVSTRIGHFAANTELYMCEKKMNINTPTKNCLDLFWLYPQVCNSQLYKMWKRNIIILPRFLMNPLSRCNDIFEFFFPTNGRHDIGCNRFEEKKEIFYPPHTDRDYNNLFDDLKPSLKFSEKEKEFGNKMLKKILNSEIKKYVCLIVRDNAYLDETYKHKNWDYHNYRNMDINNFKLASEYLTSMDYYVLRMGKVVNQSFQVDNNPKIIDYANSEFRSDFMDIYLGANCDFCVTTSVGYDAVPNIFRKPMVYVGYLPFGSVHTSSMNYITIPRQIYSEILKRKLTLKETLKIDVQKSSNTNYYKKNQLRIIENTEDEIKDIVEEMVLKLNNKWEDKEDDLKLQNRFHKIFLTFVNDLKNNLKGDPNIKFLHGKLKFKCGSRYLKENKWWLDD